MLVGCIGSFGFRFTNSTSTLRVRAERDMDVPHNKQSPEHP